MRLDASGRLWQSRGHPSAGGTHSIEPLLEANDVLGLASGWYLQSGSFAADVSRVEVPCAKQLTDAVSGALHSPVLPSAVIYAICDPIRLSERYPEGSSLMWRDAGAFMMAAQLIAHAFGLTSTLVGICLDVGASPLGGDAFAVGAVAIGGPQVDRLP